MLFGFPNDCCIIYRLPFESQRVRIERRRKTKTTNQFDWRVFYYLLFYIIFSLFLLLLFSPVKTRGCVKACVVCWVRVRVKVPRVHACVSESVKRAKDTPAMRLWMNELSSGRGVDDSITCKNEQTKKKNTDF